MLHLQKLACHSIPGINQKIQIWYRLASLWFSFSIGQNLRWGIIRHTGASGIDPAFKDHSKSGHPMSRMVNSRDAKTFAHLVLVILHLR